MMPADWWAVLDRAGFAAMRLLLSVVWQSSLLFGATALLAWALRRRSAGVRHVLWAAALLAAPLLPALGWLGSRAGAPRAEVAVMPGYEAPALPRPTEPPPAPVVRPAPRAAAPVEPAPTAPAAEPPPAPTAEPAAPPPASRVSYPWAVGLVVYVAGAIAFVSLVGLGRLRLHRCLRRGRRVRDARVVGAFAAACRAVGLRRTVVLVVSGRVAAPIALGFLRPRVLLPAGFASGLSDGELRAMAAHEVAHVRRGDALVLEAVSVLRALLFFHPLVWLASRQVAALAEQAADDAALAAIGEPTRYARMLARLAVALPERALGTELAAGFLLSKSAFLRRVEAILSDRRDQIRQLTRWALAAVLVAALGSLVLVAALPLAEKRDRTASTRAEGGPLDIRLVGIAPDCSDDVLDVDGKPFGTWLSPVDLPWGGEKLRRTFLFSVPEAEGPVLFETFHEVRVAGLDRPLGGTVGSRVVRTPEGRRLVWSVTLDHTYRDTVFGLVNRRATLRAIDVALKYYCGRRRGAELAFTGPFVPGTPAKADAGAPGTLTPRADTKWGNAQHAQFDLTTTRPLDSNVSLLAYDVAGTRHLAQRGSGGTGPGGARFEVTVPGLPLARTAALAIGEPCQRAAFRNLPLLFPDRPPRAYPAYLDRKAEALGLEAKTPAEVRQHQVKTPAEALRLVAIARGVDIEWVKMALDRGSMDFAALPPADRERIHEAARGWLGSPFGNARAAGVTLGLKGRWPEFVTPALALVAEGGHNARIEAAAALRRYRKHLTAGEIAQITDLLLRQDDPLTSHRLVRCVAESETPTTIECLWRLARADEARPWLWWPAAQRLVARRVWTAQAAAGRDLRLRRILVHKAGPGEEALNAQALALLPRLLTPELQRIDPSLFGSLLRLTCRRLDRAAATAACVGFLRGVTDFRRADWAIDRICKQLNLWHGTNLGGLGTDVERQSPELGKHDWPAIATAAVRWHDGRGNGGGAAAPKPAAAKPPAREDTAAWGKEVDGLRVRLVVDRPVCTWGETLHLYLDVWNVSDRPIRIALGDWMHREFQVMGPDDTPLPLSWRPSDRNARAGELPAGAMALVAIPQSANYKEWKPGRCTAIWPGAARSPVADARILPPSSAVEFEMRPRAKPREPEPLLDVPFGKASGGRCWRLTAARRSFRAGQPVSLRLQVKNVGAEDKRYGDPWPWGGVKARVLDARGQEVPLIAPRSRRFPPFSLLMGRNVEPGATADVEWIDLAASHYLRRPGRYTVTCRGEFAFEILPEPAADGDPIGRLLPLTKKGWAVGGSARVEPDPMRGRLVRPGSTWDRVPGREIELWPEKAGPRWRDSDSIRIWLTDQKASPAPWHTFWGELHPAEYAGKLPHWHVYISVPPKAQERWPTARDDVLLALRTEPAAAPPVPGARPAPAPVGPRPEAAGRTAYSDEIDRQVAMLEVGNVSERLRAARRLIEIARREHREAGTPMDKVEARRAVPALIRACETTGSYGPFNLPGHLAMLLEGTSGPQTKATVAWLIEMLKTDKNRLRHPAVEALGKIGPAAAPAAGELGRLLEASREFTVCWNILTALAAIGPGARPAEAAVRRWLAEMEAEAPKLDAARGDRGRSAEPRLKGYCALDRMGAIQPADAVPLARIMAESESPAVAGLGVPILLKMERLPAAIAPDVVAGAVKPNLGSTIVLGSDWERLLSRLGRPAVAPLCKALEQDVFERSSAERYLAALGADAAPAVPTLIARLQREKAGPPRGLAWLGNGWATARILAAIGTPAVEPLAALLGDEGEHVRALAVLTLGDIGGQAALRHVQSARDDPSDGVQAAVHAALLRYDVDREPHLRALCALVESGSPPARGIAAQVLSGRAVLDPFGRDKTLAAAPRSPEVRRRMSELVGHPNAAVREAAVRVLGAAKGGPELAFAALTAALGDESAAVRRAAVEALARQGGSPAVVDALGRALSDPDAGVRSAAARALCHLRPAGKAAEKPLIRALADPKTQRAARQALVALELYHDNVEALAQDLKAGREHGVARSALFDLAKLGDQAKPAIPAIIQKLDSDESEVVEAAAYTLAKLGVKDPAAVPGLTRAVGSRYWSARIKAMEALLPMGARSAAPKVIANLGYDLPGVRRVAAHWLGQMRIAQAVGPLARRLAADKDVGVRVEAAIALGRIGKPAAAAGDAVRRAAQSDDPRLRLAALFATARAGTDPGGNPRDALREQLEHPNPVVRQLAAQLLDELDAPPDPGAPD